MKISTAAIKLIACGALVAVGLTVGSGSAHAVTVLVEPTADECKSYAQYAVDEGENETLADELREHNLDPSGCPAPATDCLATVDSDGDYDCNSDDETPPTTTPAVDCRDAIDYDGDYDCTQKPATVAVGETSTAPVVVPAVESAVKGVAVSNAAPAAAVTPAKAATLSTPVLAAAATPAATTAKALPLTGGDVTGTVLLALASLGIGGALLVADKRRRTA